MAIRQLAVTFVFSFVFFGVVSLWGDDVDYTSLVRDVSALMFNVALFSLATMFSVFVFFTTAGGRFIDKYVVTKNFRIFRSRLKHNLTMNALLALGCGGAQIVQFSTTWGVLPRLTVAAGAAYAVAAMFSSVAIVWLFFIIVQGEELTRRSRRGQVRTPKQDEDGEKRIANP